MSNNMVNGLDIKEAQFMKMGSKERDMMMFRNVVHIRKQLKDYAITKKIQYAWLTVLTLITAAVFGIKTWFVG